MAKKFELTEETTKIDGKTLHRIKALIAFKGVHEGDLGGFVESEENLSHEGDCWIFDDSMVSDKAVVKGNAAVCDESWVKGEAVIEGDAIIRNSAIVAEKATVKDKAWVDGGDVRGEATIEGYCQVRGEVSGHAKITDNVVVESGAEVIDAEVSGTTVVVKGCEINGDIKVKFTGRLKPIEITPEQFGAEYLGESDLVKFKKTAKLLKEAIGLKESNKHKEVTLDSDVVDAIKQARKHPFTGDRLSGPDRYRVEELRELFDNYDIESEDVMLAIDYTEEDGVFEIAKCDINCTDGKGFDCVIEYEDAPDALSWLALMTFDL